MSLRILVSALLALVLVSPATAQQPLARAAGDPVPFKTIERGTSSTLTTPMDRVIFDPEQFVELWLQLHANDPNRVAILPRVNFAEEMVIVVSMGEQPTTGYSIKVTKLVEARGASPDRPLLKVFVRETRPGENCTVEPTPTQPFHVIKTKRFDDVTFRRTSKLRACDE